ncbi:hypothetical protein EV646_12310 [Kribbella antiqua]|uniref:Antirestriction protein ArdC n=1 Tax=Kribbella antiqua TaxID=2512217 RepID=A0A4R2I0T2_9ACTN|nr:ArdC-like ssDNA-binding domain-containing protein [Kribbella antiqua]TCO37623.1 hypothetical protein EV646_12310 [Kribbella antiqua]
MNNARVSAEDLHRVLEAEVRKLRSGEEWTRWLDAAALFPRYGFGNVVLITLQMPEASWVAGFKAWGKLGRRVKAGRGIKILAPIHARPKTESAEQPEQPAVVEGTDAQLVGFRVTTVWDITHTVGAPIPQPPTPAPVVGTAPVGLWDALAREVGASGFTLSRRSTGDDSEGFTDYVEREIVIGDRLDDVTAVARLAHEVGHLRMHSPAEDAGAGNIMCRGVREVEAESVAYIVLAHHGLTVDGSSFPYVAGWASTVDEKEPERVIKATGARVVNTARQLIDSTSTHMETNRPTLSLAPATETDLLFVPPGLNGPEL